MDQLLQRTAVGGAWASYFPTKRAQVQARYQAAKSVYQQIAAEAFDQPTGRRYRQLTARRFMKTRRIQATLTGRSGGA